MTVGPAAAALPRVMRGVAANRGQAPKELNELHRRIVRGCRRAQRFWESGMHADDLGPLDDAVDRAQLLYSNALSASQASDMGIRYWSGEAQMAMKVCTWTLGLYTPDMEKMKGDIDYQIDLAQKIASQENLEAAMEPTESAEGWCAWVSVDPRTGDVVPYPRSQARRIEAAWQEQKESVYLGSDFHGATVIFKTQVCPHHQKTAGGARSVQRVCLSSAYGGIANLKIAGEPGSFHFELRCNSYDYAPFEISPSALVRTPIVGEAKTQIGEKKMSM